MSKQTNEQLIILTAGGTIDKGYGVGAGVRDLTVLRNPAVDGILKGVQSVDGYPILSLMAKDSLDMTDNDRAMVSCICASVPQRRILITHGTDTAHKTAEAIARKKMKKTVVITAAGQPAVVMGSDANFNVGFALSSALLAPYGVYIAMNARLYVWNRCKKDPASGIFVPV